jgi:NAD(P)-binding Rossmann-like domain
MRDAGPPPLETDYLIVGAGAAGMAFADTLLAHSDASVILVDRRACPGGHWNDAYPFVHLHLPSHMYGVNSMRLGDQSLHRAGLNQGLLHMSSGAEIVAYYERVMTDAILASGRATFLPMTEFAPDGMLTALVSGERRQVRARRRVVDATYGEARIPATHARGFSVAQGIDCIPINDLVRVPLAGRPVCVIGAGKTGIDACLWLLENGLPPGRLHWIVPRDAWWMNRANLQYSEGTLHRSLTFMAEQAEALAAAESIEDLFCRLETRGICFRLDPTIMPSMYHGASISQPELDRLRGIGQVVRLGRVRAIERAEVLLDVGRLALPPGTLFVDCSASGIPQKPTLPVFADGRITLQWVKAVRPAFSAALIARVEAAYHDDTIKNRCCAPIMPPRTPADWLRMLAITLQNQAQWATDPALQAWADESHLNPGNSLARFVREGDDVAAALLARARAAGPASLANLHRLLQATSAPTLNPN